MNMYMYQIYIDRFRQYGDKLDAMFLIWIRAMSARTQNLSEEDQIQEIITLVAAYKAVKAGDGNA